MPTQRKITDKIGEIINPRFDQFKQATIGDLHFHGHTFASREAIEMVKRGDVSGISAEHVGAEVLKGGKLVAESILYLGAALVNKGACKTCTIPHQAEARRNAAAAGDSMTGEENNDPVQGEEIDVRMLSEQFEGRIGAIENELKEKPDVVDPAEFRQLSETLNGAMETVSGFGDVQVKMDEMTETIRQLGEKLDAAEGEIRALKEVPRYHTEHSEDNPFADDDDDFRALSSEKITIGRNGTITKKRW
jgi:hypothetical protein